MHDPAAPDLQYALDVALLAAQAAAEVIRTGAAISDWYRAQVPAPK